MPVYEFKCMKCGAVRDEYHKNREVQEAKCVCGGPMRRLVSAPNFRISVNRPEDLFKKKDGPDAERNYKQHYGIS